MSAARRWPLGVVILLIVLGWVASGRIAPEPSRPKPPVGRAPVMTSVQPDSGSVQGGERVTVTGSGFLTGRRECPGAVEVWFGTDPVERFAISATGVRILSDSRLIAVVPPSNGGPVDVQVHTGCGTTIAGRSDVFRYRYPPTQCLTGTCGVAVSSTPAGPLTHTGAGLLNGFTAVRGRNAARIRRLLDALGIRQWRISVFDRTKIGNVFQYCDSCRRSTAISLDLTTDWQNWAASHDPRFVQTPYDDIGTYYRFIYANVRIRTASKLAPSYYDVWNEPTGGTIGQWLTLYATAFRAIKAADPHARVVGPSLDTFLAASPNRPSAAGFKLNLVDVRTWEMGTGYRFAALSWHEDGSPVGVMADGSAQVPPHAVPGELRDSWSPSAIARHVQRARAMFAGPLHLGPTRLFVNEYGPPWAVNIPGWLVGDLAALEGSRADAGMMTCTFPQTCTDLIDGLVGYDSEPQMPYWVLRAYAAMHGARLALTTSASNIYALAASARDQPQEQLLVGRADDCWGPVECPQFHPPPVPSAPVRLRLRIAISWRTGSVVARLRRLPNAARQPAGYNDVRRAPLQSERRLPVLHRNAILDVPGVSDGDALELTLTPAAAGRR